jgi:hypothetical protein
MPASQSLTPQFHDAAKASITKLPTAMTSAILSAEITRPYDKDRANLYIVKIEQEMTQASRCDFQCFARGMGEFSLWKPFERAPI